jgi:8-oxo-dGTP pyrophosphatase MutT (NUDIX family)
MYSTGNKIVFKNAATVILVRHSESAGWKVFLARRHHKQSFMAGAYVFPGGQLENYDKSPELLSYIKKNPDFNPASVLQEKELPEEEALSFYIAAIRETFEEVGILLGGSPSGDFVSFHDKNIRARYSEHRRRLYASEITLSDIAREEGILFFPEVLVPYAHWITPEFEKMRFDTRFFLAKLPPEQRTVADATELTESLWVTPKKALEMHSGKEIMLMPPTLKTIEELCAFKSIDELFAACAQKEIYPILPQLCGNFVLLPHDPEYSIAKYKRPVDTADSSRVTNENGVWKFVHYNKKP